MSGRRNSRNAFGSRGRRKPSSSGARKPFFQPRQIRNMGRGNRGRIPQRFDRTKPNHISGDSFSKKRRSDDKIRDSSRERHPDRKKQRSRSRDDGPESDDNSSACDMKIGAYKSADVDDLISSSSRRSKSRDKPLCVDGKMLENKEKRPPSSERSFKIRVRRSRSLRRDSEPRDKGSKGREDHFRGQDASSRGRDRRSPADRSMSRGSDNRKNNRERKGYGRRSRSRDRRSSSRDRRSRSRSPQRRSRSRERRSRSRERRSRSRERHFDSRDRRSRSFSNKRSRRHSDSSSRSRSRSRDRHRKHRSYSSSKSSSPNNLHLQYLGYKQKLDSLDIKDYGKERHMSERSGYSGGLMPVYSGQQPSTQFSPPPFHPSQFQVPPPPGVESYSQSSSHIFPPNQPPPAPYISSQTPPAPFISSQTSSVPPPMGAPQQYTAPMPPILSHSNLPPSQYPHISSGPTEEYGHQNYMSGEFLASGYGNFENTSQNEMFSSSRQIKDFGVNWKPSNPPSSSIVIYPQSGPENSNARTKASTARSVPKITGVEEEKQNQKQTLVLQRDQYLQKNASLQKELARLKEQRAELLLEVSPDSDRLLKENTELQSEITKRLKAIENVVEMFSGLIKKDPLAEKEKKYSDSSASVKDFHKGSPPVSSNETKKTFIDNKMKRRNDSEEKERGRMSPKRSFSPSRCHDSRTKEKDISVVETSPPPLIFPKLDRERSPYKAKIPLFESSDQMKVNKSITEPTLTFPPVHPTPVNLVHYDPELHWCSICNVFPRTVSDYLNHLHTQNHKHQISVTKMDPSPWHADNPPELSPPLLENAPSKRIPIRGVEFLVPSTGWYCRLCKSWIGDMHCAQEHLKGRKHTSNYSEYISQNPHWEVDWLSDRTKSFERSSEYLSRLREKETVEPSLNKDLESEKAKFSKLSDTLLAVLAQQNKRQRQTSSSTSSLNSSDDGRKKMRKSKRKKSKKKKKKDETPDKISRNRSAEKSPHVTHYRQSNVNEEDPNQKPDIISDWMLEDKSELPIAIKLKNKAKEESDQLPEGKSLTERHKFDRESKIDRFRDDRGRGDERGSRDERYRDDRENNKNWSRGRDQYDRGPFNPRDQFQPRDQFSSRDHYNRKDSKEKRDVKKKFMEDSEREESSYKKGELQKKNLPAQRVDEPQKSDKRKSPLKVFQRPDDPLDLDSPEPVEKKDKSIKSDKPQGKLWFPSKEATGELEEEEEEGTTTPPEKPLEEKIDIKKKVEVKKVASFTIPKTKLPFIGRMPILKKKPLDVRSDETVKDAKQQEVEQSKEGSEVESKLSRWDIHPSIKKTKSEPKVTQKIITEIFSPEKKTVDDFAEQDMDITNDDQDDVTWVDEGQKGDLHQDFQDALDLLFPEGDGTNKVQEGAANRDTNILSNKSLMYMGSESDLYAGVGPPMDTGSVMPSLRAENTLMLNVKVPPPMIPGHVPVRSDGQLLSSVAPPSMGHSGPLPMGSGPPPMIPSGPGLMGPPGPMGLSVGDDINPLLTRPPPSIGSGSSSLRPPMVGPGPSPHLPLGHMMGPRHMGPPIGVMDGSLIRPQGGTMGMPLRPNLYSPEEELEEPVQKRKNAPSQRMRRHMQKKRAEAEARAKAESSLSTSEVKTKYEGMDVSDLAMLGIDESDSIIT